MELSFTKNQWEVVIVEAVKQFCFNFAIKIQIEIGEKLKGNEPIAISVSETSANKHVLHKVFPDDERFK